jgi:hypothetical protein
MAGLMLGQHLASATGATMQGALARQVDVVHGLSMSMRVDSSCRSAPCQGRELGEADAGQLGAI